MRPGREHDTTAARADPDLVTQFAAWVDDGQLGLADLGYEGEVDTLRIPIKKTAGSDLSCDQQAYNAAPSQVLGLLPARAHGLFRRRKITLTPIFAQRFSPQVAGSCRMRQAYS